MTDNIRLGISSCLLGENVRYDGQHKLDRYLAYTLGKYVEYVPVCPEVECGLPVPREAMRLVGTPESPRLMTQKTGHDMTGKMLEWADSKLNELEKEHLCGFIFKSKSPSSGMERVKVYNEKGGVIGRGTGIFAGAFMKRFPLMPVEDDGRLNDPGLRENFIERVFALDRYRKALELDRSLKTLKEFHARHKLLLMSHSQQCAREMGRCLARADGQPLARTSHSIPVASANSTTATPHGGQAATKSCEISGLDKVVCDYEATLKKAMALPATPAKHANVLQHLLGYFKKDLTAFEKQEALDLIEEFKEGDIPLIVPVTLFKHYANKYQVQYLQQQYYLQPHPLELKLRNHS